MQRVSRGSILLQMLLCVGSFFGISEQSKAQWKSYVEGGEKGM